jgi:hypothetical protein
MIGKPVVVMGEVHIAWCFEVNVFMCGPSDLIWQLLSIFVSPENLAVREV